jgi:tetratricopeptide (TPR) repeat protein
LLIRGIFLSRYAASLKQIMPADYRQLTAHVNQCLAARRLADCEASLQAIVRLNPKEHYAWGLLACIALERGEAEAAIDLVQRAIGLQRKNPDYLNLLGVAYAELGRHDDALAALRKSLRERPVAAEPHYNAGKIHFKIDDFAGAREAFSRAIALDARYSGARYMLGCTLLRLGELEAAVANLRTALADEPDDPGLIQQYGTVLAATQGTEAAIRWLKEAAERLPRSAMVRRAHAHALLAAGRFRDGWREYLARAFSGEAPRNEFPVRLERDLRGSKVMLLAEQGLGDVIFFLRFVPALRERGAQVSIRVPDRLVPLLSRSGMFDNVQGQDEQSVERGLFVGDLPYVLEADTPPPSISLAAVQDRVAGWRERLAAIGPPPYIGVTWRGGTDFRQEREFGRDLRVLFKEVEPAQLGRGLRNAGGTLVSAQRRPAQKEARAFAESAGRPVHDASAMNDDLEDALALLDALDEYVGVSNTNMHLRAVLGKTARVLVPFPPEWRWMANGDESPWFPGFAIYRQTPQGSWDGALARLAADLTK